VKLDLPPFDDVDLDCVDRLARLVLEARRLGFGLHFFRADDELRALVRFVGLDDVIALADAETDADP
jgi:hypothetical protein